MPILLLILLLAVLAYMWASRRHSTLTRACRWRLDRATAPDAWRCAACGATTRGAEPRDCLRPGR
jgi:rubrerythrin